LALTCIKPTAGAVHFISLFRAQLVSGWASWRKGMNQWPFAVMDAPNSGGRDAAPPVRLEDCPQLIEAVPDALLLVDAGGRIRLANTRADDMFGYPRGALAGTSVDALVPPRLRPGHVQRRIELFAKPRALSMEERSDLFGLRRDGTEFPVEINLAPVQTDAGVLVSAAVRDVTARRLLESQVQRKNEKLAEQYRRVQEANRLKSEFLANMSHELRTPLNAIIGFSEMMHAGRVGPMAADQREYVGDILASARHLLQLINDVLDLAKVEAGRMEFHAEAVNLPRLVSEVRDVVRTLLARKRIRLAVEIDPAVQELVLDAAKLKQVLYNYLSNAIKFTPDNGAVTVRALPEGQDQFRLEVRDTGIGIAPQDLGKLFTEFRQLDTSTAKKYQGTGLGLALTRRIVEAQAGRVGVDSVPGQGSTFHAVLPRRAGAIATAASTSAAEAAGAPLVLVIEDDAADRSNIELALTGAGYAVLNVATGREARAQCEAHTFEAITLDLMLPDEDGWDVLAAIRRGRNAATPVVVISVVADAPAPLAVLGVHEVLSKPVQPQPLLQVLRRHLGARAP
jgi:PAS domain S-box-containing protein